MPKPKASPQTAKDYENLGRTIASIYETGYLDHAQSLKMSFLKGVVTGFGGVLGATILVAILVWILSLFDSVPLIGPFVDKVNDTVNSQNN